jgi:hypothetical protein
MKRELVLALGILFLGIPTMAPAHNGSSTVAEDSMVQTSSVDGAIHFGNRMDNQPGNESMTLVFDDYIAGADDNSGRDVTEDADVQKVVEFKRMLALPESMAGGLNDAGVIRGVQPGGRPWKVANAEGRLNEDGVLSVKVEGLLLEGEDMNSTSSSFRALVSCIGDAGETTFVTPDFPVDEFGNAQIEHKFDSLGLCIAPVVFVGSGSDAAMGAEEMNDLNTTDFRWFAVTGHSFGGATASPVAGNPEDAAPVAAAPETIPGNGLPPLSAVNGGSPAPAATGIAADGIANGTGTAGISPQAQPTSGVTGITADDTPPATVTATSPANSTTATESNAAIDPPVAALPPVAGTTISGLPPRSGLPPVIPLGAQTTGLSGLASTPVTGTGIAGAIPPATAPSPITTTPPAPLGSVPSVAGTSPIITAPQAPATSPLLGPPDAGTFTAPGSLDDNFPGATFDDPVPATGFSTAPGFPLSSRAFDDTRPFRFDGNFTDLALASPVF